MVRIRVEEAVSGSSSALGWEGTCLGRTKESFKPFGRSGKGSRSDLEVEDLTHERLDCKENGCRNDCFKVYRPKSKDSGITTNPKQGESTTMRRAEATSEEGETIRREMRGK